MIIVLPLGWTICWKNSSNWKEKQQTSIFGMIWKTLRKFCSRSARSRQRLPLTQKWRVITKTWLLWLRLPWKSRMILLMKKSSLSIKRWPPIMRNKSFWLYCRANTTGKTPFWLFMPEPAVRNLKTGYRCCYGCIPAGRNGMGLKWKFSISSTERKQAWKAPRYW